MRPYCSIRLYRLAFTIASILLWLNLHSANSFSISDTFHLVQTAASAISHQTHAGELLSSYKHLLVQHALPTKMLTGATLAVTGDAIAQSKARGGNPSEKYDVRRAGSFAVFDSCYRALQHVAFPVLTSHFHGQLLGGSMASAAAAAAVMLSPSSTAATLADQAHVVAAAMEQTLASQLIIVPFLYYPAFFALTGSMQGLDAGGCMQRAKANFLPLMQRNLAFWIPVQFVQFAFIPTDLQIPFLSCAGLAWTFILSVAAGSAKQYSNTNNFKESIAIDPVVEQLMAVVNDAPPTIEVTDISDRAAQLVEA